MKYRVKEVYTPDDPANDRCREEFFFESDSTDIYEVAVAARAACHASVVSEQTMQNIKAAMNYSDVRDQLEDQELSDFTFQLFGNSGTWDMEVEQC